MPYSGCPICGIQIDSHHEKSPLCSYCQPDVCLCCPSSSISFEGINDDNELIWKCSHGCKYTLTEYTSQKIYTVIMNGSPVEMISLGGNHIEVIIPRGTPINVHNTIPDSIPEENIIATHYTPDADILLDEGFDFPVPDEIQESTKEWEKGTIREEAVYGWPFSPEYTEKNFSWQTDYVIVEVPREECYISSYQLLNTVTFDGEFSIPVEHYDKVTVTPTEFETACEKYNRPVEKEQIIWNN